MKEGLLRRASLKLLGHDYDEFAREVDLDQESWTRRLQYVQTAFSRVSCAMRILNLVSKE